MGVGGWSIGYQIGGQIGGQIDGQTAVKRARGGAWTTGAAPPTARMAPVPGGRMAPNWLTPNMPRLETVKVPDENSAGLSLPALACGLGALSRHHRRHKITTRLSPPA